MKSIIYKNPVVSGIAINVFAMFLSIYAIKYSITPLTIAIIPVGILNRKIIDNGIDMNNKKKSLIIISCAVMLVVCFLYIQYFHNVINLKLENM